MQQRKNMMSKRLILLKLTDPLHYLSTLVGPKLVFTLFFVSLVH